MKARTITLSLALAMAATAPAWAVNKCTGADGKVVFQDAPCAGKGEQLVIRPASGAAPVANAANLSDAKVQPSPQTEAQRIEARVAESQRQRRATEMQNVIVPRAYAAIDRHRSDCESQIQALRDQKRLASNNLAGATWEASLSGEMTAVATTCDTRNRELRETAAALLAECKSLGGCK
jgi:hypothetical protein